MKSYFNARHFDVSISSRCAGLENVVQKKKRTTNDNIQARTEFGVTHFFRGVVYKVRGNR